MYVPALSPGRVPGNEVRVVAAIFEDWGHGIAEKRVGVGAETVVAVRRVVSVTRHPRYVKLVDRERERKRKRERERERENEV